MISAQGINPTFHSKINRKNKKFRLIKKIMISAWKMSLNTQMKEISLSLKNKKRTSQ